VCFYVIQDTQFGPSPQVRTQRRARWLYRKTETASSGGTARRGFSLLGGGLDVDVGEVHSSAREAVNIPEMPF
jgi:hypothetical protein